MCNLWTPKLTCLKTKLDNHSSETVKSEWNAYLDGYFKASKHYQESKIASPKNNKLRLTEASKQIFNDKKALPSPFVSFSGTTFPFFRTFPHFLLWTYQTCPFKTKPSEDQKAKLISYSFWTITELQTIVNDFPKATEDPYRFAEELNIVIQTHQPGFSNLYQLVHVLVGEDQADWMKAADWENPKRSLKL